MTLENVFSIYKTISREVKRHYQSIYNKKYISKSYFVSTSAGLSIPDQSIWVGGNDQSEEGKFEWVNGNPVLGIPWGCGQPDNSGGIQDCMGMYKSIGKFYDHHCAATLGYMCELMIN